MKVVQYMNPEEAGDYPERQREYKLEIRKAKQLLRKVYSSNNVIFDELDLNTHIGLMASLGTLNIGDEPFIDYKRDAKAAETFNAETFNADSKEEARLKKYEKTYGKEGAKVRNRIFKRIIAKADWGTKANQWSARKAQALTDEYEEAMKGKGKKAYNTSKRTKTQKSLKKWGDQKWNTKSGQDSSKTGERYLPEKAIKALTDKEYKKTSAKKRQDSKKGKQFSDQPKDIAKKVAKYRAESFNAQETPKIDVEDFNKVADAFKSSGLRVTLRLEEMHERDTILILIGLDAPDQKIRSVEAIMKHLGYSNWYAEGKKMYSIAGNSTSKLDYIEIKVNGGHQHYRAETFEAEGKVGKNKWLQAIYDAIYDENDPSYKIMYQQYGQYGYPITTESWLIEISMRQKALADGKKPPTKRQVKNGMLKSINEASGKKWIAQGGKEYGTRTVLYEYDGKRFFVEYTVQKPPTRGAKEPYSIVIKGVEYFENPLIGGGKELLDKRLSMMENQMKKLPDWESFRAESFESESKKPHSINISRSSNSEKKLMAVFEDKDGKKIKTTHFGARGMSDYTKHGDKDRMKLYESRHKKNEHWNRPMTAGSLSKNILWNKPSLAGSFNDYKRRFGLKGDLKVSRSAESYEYKVGDTIYYTVQVKPKYAKWWKDQRTFNSTNFEGAKNDYEQKVKLKKRVKLVRHYEVAPYEPGEEIIMINDNTPHKHRTKGPFEVSRSAESYGAEGYSPEMEKARIMQNRYIPPNFKVERKDGRKYLFLDFDNTVRHTIPDPKPDEPKRRRPPHKAEEVLMIDGVKERVHEWADAGYFVVGLTNQSNIESGYNTTQDVVDAIKRTLDLLDMQFPVYFASHKNKNLPDYNYRKPMTGMIDGAFRDFGSPSDESVMVGDDWEGADSGMAENADVHFVGVLPFIDMDCNFWEYEINNSLFNAGERFEVLNPDDLIPTFAEEYDRKMNTFSAEDSYSKSTTSFAGINMKMSMGTIVGVIGALVLGYNAPSLYSRYMKKETSEAESMREFAENQGFMEDWQGGDDGGGNLVAAANEPVPPMVSPSYDPFATADATSYDPLTRPPSFI